jgi:pimeloyl-ACP methyl ester carboxylesterase
MQHFSSDGIDIAFTDEGEGAPVLLVHGFGSNSNVNWRATGWINRLRLAGYRVVALDNRGHGQSQKLYEPAAYHPSQMATDAANLLDHLGVEAAGVIGYSMGGRIAAFMAVEHPARVEAAVLGGIAMSLVEGRGGEDAIAEALLAPDGEALEDPTGRLYRKFADQTKSDLRALAACIVGQAHNLNPAELASIVAPVLVAVGTRDDSAGSPAELAALIPHGEALAIPGRDHMLATGDKVFKEGAIKFLGRHLGRP